MSQQIIPQNSGSDYTDRLLSLLEASQSAAPSAAEELLRHEALRRALEDHRRRSEATLYAWRQALSYRWECEVRAQRVFSAAQRQIQDALAHDPTYLQLINRTAPQNPITPSDLVTDLRRLAASLSLLNPHQSFDTTDLDQLNHAAAELAAAIEETDRCERERRSILLEQRITNSLYERACAKTRTLLTHYLPTSDE